MSHTAADPSGTVPDALGSSWRRSLLVLLSVVAVVAGLHRETLVVMERVWAGSETFTHAYLVPVITAWLLWRQRAVLAAIAPRPSFWMLVPMAVLEGAWVMGDLMLVNSLTQFAVVGLLVSCAPLVLGLRVARAAMFPLGFLFFAVPFGDFLLPLLMEWTADFTVAALSLSGIPVYREGLQFVIPSGNWSVVEACSGIRYLIASLMVGSLFAYLNYLAAWKRWVFVAFALLVPIVANWIRAYLIVIVGHLSSNRLAVGVDHLIYGWVFFGLVITIMFMVGARWAEPWEPVARQRPPDAPLPPALGATLAAALSGLALVAATQVLTSAMDRYDRTAALPVLSLPDRLGFSLPRWDGSPTGAAWAPVIHEPRARGHRIFGSAGESVELHTGYFRSQDWNSKLVNSMHAVTRGEDTQWNVTSAGEIEVVWRTRRLTVPVTRVKAPPGMGVVASASNLVVRLYWVDGEFEVSPAWTKLRGAISRLQGRGDDGAIVMFSSPGKDEAGQHAILRRALSEGLADVDRALSATRERR